MADDNHWLQRPSTVAGLKRAGLALLGLSLLAEFLYEAHPHFGVDGWFGFHAAFGLLSGVALLLLAGLLGVWLVREPGYYEGDRK